MLTTGVRRKRLSVILLNGVVTSPPHSELIIFRDVPQPIHVGVSLGSGSRLSEGRVLRVDDRRRGVDDDRPMEMVRTDGLWRVLGGGGERDLLLLLLALELELLNLQLELLVLQRLLRRLQLQWLSWILQLRWLLRLLLRDVLSDSEAREKRGRVCVELLVYTWKPNLSSPSFKARLHVSLELSRYPRKPTWIRLGVQGPARFLGQFIRPSPHTLKAFEKPRPAS